jgi:hypothetical protein
MNLASRCREAMNHVAMLKKDLAMQRSAEAMQRQQDSNKSLRTVTNAAKEMYRMDRIRPQTVADSPRDEEKKESEESPKLVSSLVHSPKLVSSLDDSPKLVSSSEESPRLVSSDDYEEEDEESSSSFSKSRQPPSLSPSKQQSGKKVSTSSSTVRALLGSPLASSPLASSPARESKTSSPVDVDEMIDLDDDSMESPGRSPVKAEKKHIFPDSASPRVGRGNYNEEYPGDITAAAVRHHPYQSPRLTDFQESTEGEEESSVHSSSSGSKRLSSIDAFEASFQTDFPASFSPKDEEKKAADEIYNPFSSSPARSDKSADTAAHSISSITSTATETDESTTTTSPVSSGNKTRDRVAKLAAEKTATSTSPVLPGNKTRELAAQTVAEKTATPMSPVSPSRGNGIRERAAAAYRRSSANRLAVPSDPPGKDKTSTRKSGPLGSQGRDLRSPHVTESNFPVDSISAEPASTTPASLLPSSVFTPEHSPGDTVKMHHFHTPSPLSSQPNGGIASGEPTRPEKTGFDVARARYEKALLPRPASQRSNSGEIPYDTEPASPDRSKNSENSSKSPSTHSNILRARIAAYSDSVPSPETKTKDDIDNSVPSPEIKTKDVIDQTSWRPTSPNFGSSGNLPFDEEDGEIPMRSRAVSSERPWGISPPIKRRSSLEPPFAPKGAFVDNFRKEPTVASRE